MRRNRTSKTKKKTSKAKKEERVKLKKEVLETSVSCQKNDTIIY